MARQKTWDTEDRQRALEWVTSKAKTGAVFRGQDAEASAMLPTLVSIEDPADFGAAVEAALTQAAWRRLLGALRQRRHQAEAAGDDDGQKADAGACEQCQRYREDIASLEAEASRNLAFYSEIVRALHGAMCGKPGMLTRYLAERVKGDAWQMLLAELGVGHQVKVDEAPAPAPAADRDTAIVRMFQAGESKRAISRALGVSDGTVRNVLKRHQVEAA